ncbi:MAG: membrane protein insertase YidC [Bacteroidales bacterium]|nr:membrane protein insertase YidC [Bacteroidales bacterium]
MNKNSILGFLLIAAIMVGYTVWMTPSAEEMAQKQRVQDSIAAVNKRRQFKADSIRKLETKAVARQMEQAAETPQLVESEVSASYSERKSRYDVFANSAVGSDKTYVLENELVKIEIGSRGGFIRNVALKDYQTYDSLPLTLFNPQTTELGLSFFVNNRAINTSGFYFHPARTDSSETHLIVNADRQLIFSMRLYADAGEGALDRTRYIEYLYTLESDNYMFDLTINLVNMQHIISANTNYIDLNWFADLRKQERSADQFSGLPTIYYKYYQDDVEYMDENDDEIQDIKTKLKWVSFKQRFFSSTLVAKNSFDNGTLKVFTKQNPASDRYLRSMQAQLGLPYDKSESIAIPLQFYFGPNQFYGLKSYNIGLEDQIPVGWGIFGWINKFIVIPVFNWLGSYGWNYGIVILVLTLMLKTALFPIAYKTYLSSAKMRVLKPEVDELSKKFPKKEDALKKQQAVMGLYKKAGANPASGCVPMLLQMPILIAMFRFFPASIELRQQSFLWATDLSSYDSIMNLPFDIPYYGDHVSLFTLLMTVSTIMYTYMNNQMMGSQTQQMPGMKTMMYLMPIMFLGLFNNYASGLSYYYFLANIITFGQMFAFRYLIDEDKLRAKIEANKKKPAKKKSNFQKRLEEAARQRNAKR